MYFAHTRWVGQVEETQEHLARIDLAEGRPEKALKTLNEVLDHEGVDIVPRRVASVYKWRSRANEALHNYSET